jgi:hypothetical protein
MGAFFFNCVKAYTKIQMFLENTHQKITSHCNPDISHYPLFCHAINALARKRCMTGLKNFTCQYWRKILALISISESPFL